MAGCLDGVRVIDLGRYQAGPRCSMILGDLGAEVIKVEAAPDGDESRRLGMVYWSQYNRGKKSITLNLRSARGQTILKELVPKSDMLLQNFSPGVMDAMGLGYDALKQLNPGIIMINVSGFGQFGPYRNRRAFDPIGQSDGRGDVRHRLRGRAAGAMRATDNRPDYRASRDHRRARRAASTRCHGRRPGAGR